MARGFSKGTRQRKLWRSAGASTTVSSSTNSTTTIPPDLNDNTHPFTVLRMLGNFVIHPTAVNVLGDRWTFAVGIGVFSQDAIAVGGSALPDPIGDENYPWLYWYSAFFQMSVARRETEGDPSMGTRVAFDIRSMRKVKPREGLIMVVQYIDESGAPTAQINVAATRVLIGL